MVDPVKAYFVLDAHRSRVTGAHPTISHMKPYEGMQPYNRFYAQLSFLVGGFNQPI